MNSRMRTAAEEKEGRLAGDCTRGPGRIFSCGELKCPRSLYSGDVLAANMGNRGAEIAAEAFHFTQHIFGIKGDVSDSH